MSVEARAQLCSKLVFQRDSQKSDLMGVDITKTQLVALLLDIVNAGFHLEITSVRSDHSDDSELGEHSHANGWCADLWPLKSSTPGDYLDATDPQFQAFLCVAAASQYLHQIGLAGSANIPQNFVAAGPTAFHDDGADHIHLGAQ